MIIERLVVGELDTNCYVVHSGGECIIVDSGGEADRIARYVDELGAFPKAIILTHSHADHIAGAPELRERLSAKIMIHQAEASSLEDPKLNLSVMFAAPISFKADRELVEGEIITLGEERLEVIHTPGHSPGGITLAGDGVLFVGDALFQMGIGRADLPGGDYAVLMRSIARLMKFPDDATVFPGHGPATTIGAERAYFDFDD
ncbi:MAG TPA: MBL fold metallo-hydrolase [candidate division Zixibacteria bacterium]|nr:MBL fold metallo-hydrolase [candidate division Zixibacteria bacterium]